MGGTIAGVTPARARVLFVGAFPAADRQMFGGMVTSCGALLKSSLPVRTELHLLDSTLVSNPPPGVLVRTGYSLLRLVRFAAQVERVRPDAVLLFAAIGGSLLEKGAMAWYARLRGIPAVMFPRGGGIIDACRESRFTRTWVRAAFAGARKVFCQSVRWQQFAVDVLGLPRVDAPVIANWTATPELVDIGRRREASTNARPVRLLFVAWLDREKGIVELLEACRRLAPRADFTLDIAGEGNMSAAAREIVARDGLGHRVRFKGWLRGPALADAFRNADVLVLPSWAEGMPNAMIEAMAARLAVIVTRVGSVPDEAVDGVHALLVPPRDVPALESALARMIGDADLRARLAHGGHDLAVTRFGVESAVDIMVREFSAIT